MGDGVGKHESEEKHDRGAGGGGLGSAAGKHVARMTDASAVAKRAEKSIRL